MVTKRVLLLLFLIAVGVQAVSGQTNTREIYTVLAYGDDIFEPETWRVRAGEEELRTAALWEATEYSAIGFLEYLHYDDGITDEAMKVTFNDEWFEVTLQNYDAWELLAQCQIEDVLLYEFDVVSNDTPYQMRYWIRQETETRVLAFLLVFPIDQLEELDDYSARFAPAAVSCESE